MLHAAFKLARGGVLALPAAGLVTSGLVRAAGLPGICAIHEGHTADLVLVGERLGDTHRYTRHNRRSGGLRSLSG